MLAHQYGATVRCVSGGSSCWYKTTESAQTTGPQKTSKKPLFGLPKIKPFLKHQENSYVRNFGLFLVLMGPKNAFFWAMDCSLREALHKEQSITPPKSGNDGRIEESSRRLHWSDITGTLDLITLYNMLTRADIQRSKQALQISLMTQEIICNVVAFLTKGAHTLEVLHRVHPAALLMMHTCHKFWGVSSKKKSITGGT